MKTTRTDNNKAPKSGVIKKGPMKADEIRRVAEELTKNQLTTTGSAIKTYKAIVETKAPKIKITSGANIEIDYTKPSNHITVKKIEPVEHGNYEIYSEYVKAHCKVHDTYETTGDELKKMFPQRNYGGQVAMHLKRYYGLSYRRVENGRNDTYVFFVEPTREELMREISKIKNYYDAEVESRKNIKVQLTSAESKVIELDKQLSVFHKINAELIRQLQEENSQLKSELFYSQIITLTFAIGAVITIILKSVA